MVSKTAVLSFKLFQYSPLTPKASFSSLEKQTNKKHDLDIRDCWSVRHWPESWYAIITVNKSSRYRHYSTNSFKMDLHPLLVVVVVLFFSFLCVCVCVWVCVCVCGSDSNDFMSTTSDTNTDHFKQYNIETRLYSFLMKYTYITSRDIIAETIFEDVYQLFVIGTLQNGR